MIYRVNFLSDVQHDSMFKLQNTAVQPFFYTEKEKPATTFIGSLEECVTAVLTGKSTFDPNGSWETIIDGRKTKLPNEPPAIDKARRIFKKANPRAKFRLIKEWEPGRGDDIVIIEY